YNFVTGTRRVPFFEGGVGFVDGVLKVPRDLNSQFNFTILGGPGINYFLTDNLSILAQVGLHHISNAGRKSPNVGVNSVMGLLGVSYYF
ncbi:MAG: acyloxyacyl hydrolase, partial [candidate division NC10 bacterium]|nr:acyloxyacyl hydrolase [candidate division NC10 bacterium]